MPNFVGKVVTLPIITPSDTTMKIITNAQVDESRQDDLKYVIKCPIYGHCVPPIQ